MSRVPAWPPTGTNVRSYLVCALCAVLVLDPTPVLGETVSSAGMAWGAMAMQLFGGLALFLFGMDQMAEALKAVAGDRMKIILSRLTTNRWMGAMTGAFVTAVIQSSSVTTVLVVGFITAGLMSMSQSIGVIMGANIGSTFTAQIIAFNVTQYALLMVAAGFYLLFATKQEKTRYYGAMIMGLGLLFYGMGVMGDAMAPLRSYQPFLDLMSHMENPLLGILVGTLFTALVQSSAATTGIVIVIAAQGFITLPAGIALAFGANIGTCVTALLAAIGKPREAVRAAVVHVLFNVFGVLLWVGFIDQLAQLVTLVSPTHPELTGLERLAADTPRQIANAHTIFNVANTLIFIGLAGQFARFVEWLVPDKPLEEVVITKPRYLDEELLDTPSLALERVRLEIGHMGGRVKAMLQDIMPAILAGDRLMLKQVARIDDEVDLLHRAIISYLGRISRKRLTEEQTREFMSLMAAANDLENIGDIIETDLVHLGNQRISQGVSVSDSTREVLTRLHDVVSSTAALATAAVVDKDLSSAENVISMKADINRLMTSAALHQARRLVAEEPNRLAAYTVEMDIIEKLKRIYYFAKRMAKTVLPADTLEEAASA
jgi:phosphate:Na+ symporter